MPHPQPLLSRLKRLFYDPHGKLSEELVRARGLGDLGQLPKRRLPTSVTTSVCGYCSTGCGLQFHLKQGQAVNLSPDRKYVVNRGSACPKGWEALTPLDAKDRLQAPMLRVGQSLKPVSWDEALTAFVDRMRALKERHGGDCLAFLGTGQLPSEELAFLGALARFGLGFAHGDGNTRQCMATAVTAYKQAFGFDAPPYTYQDLEESDVLVFVGSNPAIAHPILWQRVMQSQRAQEVVVVDPRRTETAACASMHLGLTPKSDLFLFYAVARLLIERGAIDNQFIAEHTCGFEAFAAHVGDFDLQSAAQRTGLTVNQIKRLADLIGSGKRISFWWTMGVNQSHQGVSLAHALIGLALMTGNIGKPGTGANSITGQCNAMGSRLFSNTSSLFGGRDFGDQEHRKEVGDILNLPVSCIPTEKGLAYDQIMEGIFGGRIKGLWIIATNSASSWINQADARDALGRLDFLVVQDMYHSTATAGMAHLLLPAAGWGEKSGTFINSERRIGVIRPARKPPGEALTDFEIFQRVAARWGIADQFRQWQDPESAFGLLKRLSAGRPCDISGIPDYAALDAASGIQWPFPPGSKSKPASQRRLFENGTFFTQDGRARFFHEAPEPPPEEPNGEYPLVLLTGRGSSAQWHTQTRTGKSAVLRKLHPTRPYVEVNADDATRLGLAPGQPVWVESRRGRAAVWTQVSHVVRSGQVFMPMHDAQTNQLTLAAFDPQSRQPAYKHCAVRIVPRNDPGAG